MDFKAKMYKKKQKQKISVIAVRDDISMVGGRVKKKSL
jgi:hypothetical protein